MLHFEGERTIALPPAALWIQLADARFLAHCMPDVEKVSRAEPLDAVFTVRPGFAFVRGSLETHLHVADSVPSQSVRYDVHSKGIGSHTTIDASLSIVEAADGSRVSWIVDIVELGGLLKAVPKGLIQASAQKVIGDVWTAIEKQLHTTTNAS
jgi:carbon monoxide dehydrogenase subunit G